MGKLKTLIAVLEETRAALEEARMRANLLAAEMGDIRVECSEAGIAEPQDETPTLRMVQALIEDANEQEQVFAQHLGHEDVDEGFDELGKLLGAEPDDSLIEALKASMFSLEAPAGDTLPMAIERVKRKMAEASVLAHKAISEARVERDAALALAKEYHPDRETHFRHLVNAFFPKAPPPLEFANNLRRGLGLDPWTTVPPEW